MFLFAELDSTTSSSQMLYVAVSHRSTDFIGIGFALAGSIFSSWITILSRQLNTVHFSVQLIWGSIGGVLISVVALLSDNSVPG